MAELKFIKPTKAFRAGVSKGVIYDGVKAIVWPGLVNVKEAVNGGDPTNHFIDGTLYNISRGSEYKSFNISAFNYPDVLETYLGFSNFNGLIIDNQYHPRFGFSYQTDIYDSDGKKVGYRIHIIYNASISVSEWNSSTLTQDGSAETMEFTMDCIPTVWSGKAPVSTFTLDSTITPQKYFEALRDILYGTATTNPRLPSFTELKSLFDPMAKYDFNRTRDGSNEVITNSVGSMIQGSVLDGWFKPAENINATDNGGYFTLG